MVYTGSLLYKNVLSPVYDKLVLIFPASVHPNTITLIGGVFAVLSNFALMADYRWSACILFTLYHMFDNMDGKHARRTKQTSEVGAILDHFVDGTAGIWSGGLSFFVILAMTEFDIAFGVWAFTTLFWSVHFVHALTGFFELGNDYVSIDEAFVLLSLVRAVWALDISFPTLLYQQWFHYVLIAFVLFSAVQWMATHGRQRITRKQLDSAKGIVAAFVVYCVISLVYMFNVDHPSIIVVLALWATPYGMVLWESKNKH